MKIKLTILFSFFYSLAFTQETFESALIPSKNGAVITYTSDEHAFTVTLNSNSIEPSDQPNFLTIDGWILQSFILGYDNPKAKDMSVEENAKRALSQYVMYELDYFKEQLKLEIEPKLEWGHMKGLYFYFWYFDTPPELETLQGQLFLTTMCFNQFLNLNIPLEKGKSFEEAKAYLMNIGKSITLHDHPIDFESLYTELNK
ncbi:MAG: hypothetical protein ABJO02_20920 [Reichenbachiella sp.]|uniref:hypothetical protein n=1 Tax=Reichenbachiella sp. TaxID=2184521 RepID=UPI0032976E86